MEPDTLKWQSSSASVIVDADSTDEVIYNFENKGSLPVRIRGVKTSCGCTTAYYDQSEIATGNKGKVVLRVSTVGKPAVFDVLAYVMLGSNEEFQKLTCKVRVKNKIDVSAHVIVWNSDELMTDKTVLLTSGSAEPFQILSTDIVGTSYSATAEASADLTSWKVHVKPSEDVTKTAILSIRLEDHSREKTIYVILKSANR